MTERLIDVDKRGERTLHTFPVTISRTDADEQAFKEKALEGAANAKLVPDEELEKLDAKPHSSRGGPLEPYGDSLSVLAETKVGLEQAVRERAYFLWETAGKPDGMADQFWDQARHEHLCARAYAIWEREGCPEGQAEQHWFRTLSFEQD